MKCKGNQLIEANTYVKLNTSSLPMNMFFFKSSQVKFDQTFRKIYHPKGYHMEICFTIYAMILICILHVNDVL
jgi:hypothetical protein